MGFGGEERERTERAGEEIERIAREQWEMAKRMYGWAARGERAPAYMYAPGMEAIEREAARVRMGLEELPPGGYRERALTELATWAAGMRVELERALAEEARYALSGASQVAISGYGAAASLYSSLAQTAAYRERSWLDFGAVIAVTLGKIIASL